MVDVNLEVNGGLRMESIGPVNYNGHWISYGLQFDEWKMRCLSCGEEYSGQSDDFNNIERAKEPYLWIHLFQRFGECKNPKEDWGDAVIEKMRMEYTGNIADSHTRNQMERTIEEDIMVGPVEAHIGFKQ